MTAYQSATSLTPKHLCELRDWFMFLPFLGTLFWPCSPTEPKQHVVEHKPTRNTGPLSFFTQINRLSCLLAWLPWLPWLPGMDRVHRCIRYILPDGTIDPLKMGIPRSWVARPQDGTLLRVFWGSKLYCGRHGGRRRDQYANGWLGICWMFDQHSICEDLNGPNKISSRCFLFSKS